MPLVNLFVGLATLLFGRQLFWLFVAAAGFVLGFNLAEQVLGPEDTLIALLVGVFLGVLGAALATLAQRLAIAIAGFVTGAYLLNLLAASFGLTAVSGLFAPESLLYTIIGGVVGAVLISAFFDVALILLSAALGASLTLQAAASYLALGGTASLILYLALLVVGIAAQWALWSDRRGGRARQ
jgi:hypothetical protein